ncbi:molybdenum cofactor biosynthesis protein MoaE [Sphingosinicella sp. BN140058]|nr:molybdenum cofactor biosynthesis protein MoaE [Sphingosinicella sp. BN140058]
MLAARLESGALEADRELRLFLDSVTGEGAVVSFVGIARPVSRDGAAVTGLYLDHYPGMTERSLATIAADAAARFDGARVYVVHRSGMVAPGEAIVFVAAASAHRRKAFEAADYLMDRLKTEAAFWKREDRLDGSAWIEPTEQDRADTQRWSQACPE